MLSRNLEGTLNRALSIASKHNHEYATYEHLLLALFHDKDAMDVFAHFNVDVIDLANKLENHLELQLTALVNKECGIARPTTGFQNIVHRAAIHSRVTNKNNISGSDILSEFFFEKDSYATELLIENGLNRKNILEFVNNSSDKQDPVIIKNDDSMTRTKRQISKEKLNTIQEKVEETKLSTALDSYCSNLNEKVKNGLIDTLIGRESEIERTIEILGRRQKNNPILVGEPGVGKTAIAEGLAYRIVKGKVPNSLNNFEIYSLDVGSLVAGTRFRGDFEERVKTLLSEVKSRPNVILFIDEIHTIVGAGSTTTASLDASNLIKPALARGEIRCIGSTTFKEFNQSFAKDAALVRRFQKIIVEEPSIVIALEILKGVKSYYEKHHNVHYSAEALESAVTLSDRFIHGRYLPDKAIDLIDEAGAHKKLVTKEEGRHNISANDIEIVLAKTLNIPAVTLASDNISKIKKLEYNLKRVIFGQDTAVEELCAGVKLAKAGLRDYERPVGCYLFVGPTGTGKTELAKQLAKFCGMEVLRLDMSEYMESHSISRLIGSPPGYAGYDKGGLLTEAIDKAPYSIVLFDEIEKAHRELFNILLQIMDYGKLTDNVGKLVDFSHTIVILTANSGAAEYMKQRIGFGSSEVFGEEEAMKVVDSTFSPEFRDRLDKIIMFNPLNDDVIGLIIDKAIKELGEQLADKNVRIDVDKKAKSHLIQNCFGVGKHYGARVLEKTVDLEIKRVIAEEILFGKLRKGGTVHVTSDGKRLVFKFNLSAMCVA